MNQAEKKHYLYENHFRLWADTRVKTEDEVSSNQSMRCVCGRLATRFHEMNCTRFQNKVDSETIKKLKHLIKKESTHSNLV